jgi:peptidoglycan/xylan/chitin deacetylase (PgdA/CDA1 family)
VIFTFSFDDGYAVWKNVGILLAGYGYKGVFNVVLRNVVHRRVKDRPKMFPEQNVITWEEILQLQQLGHEITSHGVRHVDLNLCNQTELQLELLGSYAVFESMGVDVSSYTCAFNCWTPKALEISKNKYNSFRASVDVNKLPLTGKIYHCMDGNQAIHYMRRNLEKNEWIVGAWHDVDPYRFEDTIKMVKKLGVEVKTVREMFGET